MELFDTPDEPTKDPLATPLAERMRTAKTGGCFWSSGMLPVRKAGWENPWPRDIVPGSLLGTAGYR